MIAYLENKDDKKEVVFANVLGDRDAIRKRINESKYGDVVDKFCVRKYLSEAMLLDYSNFINQSMYCNPNDILENIDIDLIMLEMIFRDDNNDKFMENASKYSSRLLILYKEVMPFIKLKETGRIISNKSCNYTSDIIESINMNTEILNLMKLRNDIKYNLGEENAENMLNKNDNFDDYEAKKEKVKKLKKD